MLQTTTMIYNIFHWYFLVFRLELAEINLAQLKAASKDEDTSSKETTAEKSENENELKQLKEEEAQLKQSLQEKDTEILRLNLENEDHLKRVSELTAYIQQATQDREQIIQQYTQYRLVDNI